MGRRIGMETWGPVERCLNALKWNGGHFNLIEPYRSMKQELLDAGLIVEHVEYRLTPEGSARLGEDPPPEGG